MTNRAVLDEGTVQITGIANRCSCRLRRADLYLTTLSVTEFIKHRWLMNAHENRALVSKCWQRRQSRDLRHQSNIWIMKRRQSAPEFVDFYLTALNSTLLKALIVLHLFKKFPEIFGARSLITATSLCRELDKSIPRSYILVLLLSLPSGFPTKTLYVFLLSLYALHATPISFTLISNLIFYYAIFFIFLWLFHY